MTTHDRPSPGWAGIVIGLMIVGLGLILLVDQTGLLRMAAVMESLAVPDHRRSGSRGSPSRTLTGRATAAG